MKEEGHKDTEGKSRGGRGSRLWGWKKRLGKKEPVRQTSRFERSMRVLEWLDPDCGTRLTQHYEQAGGWRSLPHGSQRRPQKQQQQQQSQQQQQQQQPRTQQNQLVPQKAERQPLRLTRSHILLGTEDSQKNQKLECSSSSSSEDDAGDLLATGLADSEDFLDAMGADEEEVGCSLRRLREGQLEELSMQEYVTSSEDEQEQVSDSEDELVLALKTFKEEQQRQDRLHRQLQLSRQHSLAQQPPTLTPVLEDGLASPTSQAFAYFYQDHSVVSPLSQSQRHKQLPYSGVAPFWCGMSGVREGPSSPPILVTQSEFGQTSHLVLSPCFEAGTRMTAASFSDVHPGYKSGMSILKPAPSLTVTTSIKSPRLHGTLPALYTPLLPPSSPLRSGPSPSLRLDQPNWNFNRSSAKSPVSPTHVGQDLSENSSSGHFNIKSSDNLKGDASGISPKTPLSSKYSSGGFSVFSNWLGSGLGDKSYFTQEVAASEARIKDYYVDRSSMHRPICSSLSTTSSDSGIEKSPGYLSPAPRSAGIDKIGDFFRRVHHKLSPSTSSKTLTPPPTPGKHDLHGQQQLGQQEGQGSRGQREGHGNRRLSLSTSSIPSTGLLKPSSPVAKFAAAHVRCSATRSDPLASKRQASPWSPVPLVRNPAPLLTPISGHPRPSPSAGSDGSGKCTDASSGRDGTTAGAGWWADGAAVKTSGSHAPIDRSDQSKSEVVNTTRLCEQRSGPALNTTLGARESTALASGADSRLTAVRPHSPLLPHLPLSAKRSTGDTVNPVSEKHGSDVTTVANGGEYFPGENLKELKKSREALDNICSERASTRLSDQESNSELSGGSKLAKVVSQILRKSPVAEVIPSGLVPDQNQRSTSGSAPATGVNSSEGILDDNSAVIKVSCSGQSQTGTDEQRKIDQHKEKSAMCSEVSASFPCDDRGTLSVPGDGHERGRRGSHGTCNYLFIDQASSGRKSPKPKERKSPSPIRRALFKTAANSNSSSSSSSADSSKLHHTVIGRVQSLPSPSSPPPHQQQASPKTSPKHVICSPASESPTRKPLVESPLVGYHGRRKFSDTGLTPIPRRLFSEGRRGSLTDERTLVSAKCKLGKLRAQGRKSSDTGSIAALVKQIHNLWGDKDEELADIEERRESAAGLGGSMDDQILFDKKRKRFSLSVGRSKEGLLSSEDKKVFKKSAQSLATNNDIVPSGTGKKETSEKGPSYPVSLPMSSSLSTTEHTVAEGVRCLTPDHLLSYDTTGTEEKLSAPSGPGPAPSSCGPGGGAGSEFVAPVAQVASRQLVATAVSGAACFVGSEATENLLGRGTLGSLTNMASPGLAAGSKPGKKSATVQFQPIVSWDDNVVGGKISPALRSVLKQGARRHSSFAGFSESSDNLSVSQLESSDSLSSLLNKQNKNGLPKSKTSENYKGILKQSDRLALINIDLASSSLTSKKRSKSPTLRFRKQEDVSDHSPDPRSESTLSLCLKATRSLSPKSRVRSPGKEQLDTSDTSATDTDRASDVDGGGQDHQTKNVGIQATPRFVGKTSNTGTQTPDIFEDEAGGLDYPGLGTDGSGWLHRLAAKCISSVAKPGPIGVTSTGLPRVVGVRADWLLTNKRMGSGPSSPVASGGDPSEKFWVPHQVLARKRAQSLVPTLSKSEDDLSSEAMTPPSACHPRDLTFTFPGDKPGGPLVDGLPASLGRRRASMHDAIDLNKIDTRLYDKKLVRQTSVSSLEEESQGTVHVSLEHNPETSILTVNLIRAHNLLPRDPDGSANPYFRLTLLPDQKTSAQCRIHRRTLDPVLEEEFIFELSSEEVESSTLELSLFEYDQFSTDECVGHVRIPLRGLDLSSRLDLWRAISPYEKPKDQRDVGDVMFSVSYLPSAERLTVVVVRARNLRHQNETKQDLNPFVKVCLISRNKKIKKKKTSTAHATNCPTWNEALVFSVHKDKLRNVGLEVAALHDNKLGSDERIGRVRLLADSPEGINCQDLLNEKGIPARWYSLS